MTSDSDDWTDRLKYLSNGELREEIAYTVGGDPSRYGAGSGRGLLKDDVLRVAEALQPEDSPLDLESMTLRDLYVPVCEWAGGEYEPNAGNAWGINRENLKQIHQALDAEPPREVASP